MQAHSVGEEGARVAESEGQLLSRYIARRAWSEVGVLYIFFLLSVNPKLQDYDIHVLVFDVQAVDTHERIFEDAMSIFRRVSFYRGSTHLSTVQ